MVVIQQVASESVCSNYCRMQLLHRHARVAKLADARDLKSRVSKETYRFNSGPGHQRISLVKMSSRAEAAPRAAVG
jgi:hypothetical protein